MQNIILLHGALGCERDLNPLAESLKHSGLTVYSFSFSGHGKANFNTEFGIEQFAKELEQFILKNNLKKPSVFGYSMGGFVTLYLSSKKPELVDKIITLGTKFNWSEEAVDKETRLLNPYLMLDKIPAYATLLETKHGESWKELVLKTSDMMKEIGAHNFMNSETLQKLTSKTLIGIADKDQMVSLDETTTVFKTIPNSSMYMLPNTKHQIETVNLALLTKLILGFIR